MKFVPMKLAFFLHYDSTFKMKKGERFKNACLFF